MAKYFTSKRIYCLIYLSIKSKSVSVPPSVKNQLLSERCFEDVCIDEDEKLAEIVSALDSNEYEDQMTCMVYICKYSVSL